MEQREYPVPEVPPEAMLLRVTQAGVCGTDRHIYEGHLAAPFPIIPGHEIVGTLVQVGDRALETITVVGGPVKEGDQVAVTPSSGPCGHCYWCRHQPHRTTLCPNRFVHGFLNCEQPPHLLGGMAEYLYLQPRAWIFKLPADLREARRVLVEPAAVAVNAVQRALAPGVPQAGEGVRLSSTALVLGAGPIGLLVTAALCHWGLTRIFVSDRAATRLEAALRFGAAETLNAATTTVEERSEILREHTEGVGPDLVFECAGVPAAFAEALAQVRRGGTVIELGHFTDSGAVSVHPHLICHKDLNLRGMWAYPLLAFQEAMAFLCHTALPVEDLVTHTYPLNEAERAICALRDPERTLKVVVKP